MSPYPRSKNRSGGRLIQCNPVRVKFRNEKLVLGSIDRKFGGWQEYLARRYDYVLLIFKYI